MKRHKLRVTKIGEVSLVDKGDNPTADVVIHKRKPDAVPAVPGKLAKLKASPLSKSLLTAIGKMLGKSDTEVQKAYDEATTYNEIAEEREMWRVCSEVYSMTSDLSDAITRTLRDTEAADPSSLIRTSVTQFTAAVEGALNSWIAGETVLEKSADLDKAGRKISTKRLARLKQARDALSALITEADPDDKGSETMPETKTDKNAPAPADPAAPPATPPAPEDVLKSASPEVRKLFEDLAGRVEKAETRATEADSIAKTERDARELAELRKRAESELGNLAGTPDEKAEMLRDLTKALGKEKAEKMIGMLKAADEAVRQGALFKEVGTGGAATGTAFEKIRAEAQKLLESKTVKTIEEGISKVALENPALYKQYQQEQSSR